MEQQLDVQPQSSPALEVPRDGAAYATLRQTGQPAEGAPARLGVPRGGCVSDGGVMMPERKKEQEKRRPGGRLSRGLKGKGMRCYGGRGSGAI